MGLDVGETDGVEVVVSGSGAGAVLSSSHASPQGSLHGSSLHGFWHGPTQGCSQLLPHGLLHGLQGSSQS